MIPSVGVVEAYGGFTPEYYNAFGFFLLNRSNLTPIAPQGSVYGRTQVTLTLTHFLVWGVFNMFFLMASKRL